MRFLVDRCAGRRLAEWLGGQGYDVVEARSLGPDPGDRKLLEWAVDARRIVVTIDTDFAALVFLEDLPHCGMIRLPDVPARQRIQLMEIVLDDYLDALESAAIVTVRGDRVRISRG